jgi:uncharacterized membrane protein YqaE (UPF0057 family)
MDEIQVIIVDIGQKYRTITIDKNNTIPDLTNKCVEILNLPPKLIKDFKTVKLYHDFKPIDTEQNITIKEYFKDTLSIKEKKIFIRIMPLLKGGGPLMEFIETIFNIGEIFMFILKGIDYVVKFALWLIQFIIWFISEVANPFMFVSDFISSIKVISMSLVMAPIKFLMFIIKKMVNGILESVIGAFWGWDKVPRDGWDYHSAKYFNENVDCRSKKCYVTKNNRIPFSIIIGTIICPPIGVFMEYGFTGWINILVCILLTTLYYFPGLIYALMILYT